jgi:hypothetical protein
MAASLRDLCVDRWSTLVVAVAVRDELLRQYVLARDAAIRGRVHHERAPWERIAQDYRHLADAIDAAIDRPPDRENERPLVSAEGWTR